MGDKLTGLGFACPACDGKDVGGLLYLVCQGQGNAWHIAAAMLAEKGMSAANL